MTAAATLLPFVRHLSVRVTPVLARLPVSANQVTAASLVLGLAAAVAVSVEGRAAGMAAGLLLVLCYVLDNCDGEIARLKNQCSRFGMHFDTFVDWIVHAAFFLGLGFGVERTTGEALWPWLGGAAAAGGTFNYLLGLVLPVSAQQSDAAEATAGAGDAHPRGVGAWIVFAFRELTRADFCFIVLALGALDGLWVLLPAGAIGAQLYWLTRFFKGTGAYHV